MTDIISDDYINIHLETFKQSDSAIAEMQRNYMGLSINGLTDSEGYKIVKSARMVVKTHRVDVDKKRKMLVASALKFQRSINDEAKRITSLLQPIEEYLSLQEKSFDEEKDRIKKQKEQAELQIQAKRMVMLADMKYRVHGNEMICDYCEIKFSLDHLKISSDSSNVVFDGLLEKATENFNIYESRLIEEENQRKEKERIEKESLQQEIEKLRQIKIDQEKKAVAELKEYVRLLEEEKQKFFHENSLKEYEPLKKEIVHDESTGVDNILTVIDNKLTFSDTIPAGKLTIGYGRNLESNNSVDVLGTTTIKLSNGDERSVVFTESSTLNNHSSIVLPSGDDRKKCIEIAEEELNRMADIPLKITESDYKKIHYVDDKDNYFTIELPVENESSHLNTFSLFEFFWENQCGGFIEIRKAIDASFIVKYKRNNFDCNTYLLNGSLREILESLFEIQSLDEGK